MKIYLCLMTLKPASVIIFFYDDFGFGSFLCKRSYRYYMRAGAGFPYVLVVYVHSVCPSSRRLVHSHPNETPFLQKKRHL